MIETDVVNGNVVVSKVECDEYYMKIPICKVPKMLKGNEILEALDLIPVHYEICTCEYIYCKHWIAPIAKMLYWIENVYWYTIRKILFHKLHLVIKEPNERFSWKHNFKPFILIRKLI